jgi:hypothetical protein
VARAANADEDDPSDGVRRHTGEELSLARVDKSPLWKEFGATAASG